jgi:methionine-S-sulfoxide reductase
VVRTRVGYTGGKTVNPNYYNIGDHTESFQVDYDPTQTSYEKLLDVFWNTHNPCAASSKTQYMTAVFFHNDAQKKLAVASRDRESKKHGKRIATLLLPLKKFYLAEDYHQKYALKQRRDIFLELYAMYPVYKDFMHSTAVARVNGYLGGYGTAAELEKELPGFGLSPQASNTLLELVKQVDAFKQRK